MGGIFLVTFRLASTSGWRDHERHSIYTEKLLIRPHLCIMQYIICLLYLLCFDVFLN
jgi:hypothetical protein